MHEFDDYFDTNFLCVLASIVGEDGVLMAEPMRDHTTFNIGGPADVMILPRASVWMKVLMHGKISP